MLLPIRRIVLLISGLAFLVASCHQAPELAASRVPTISEDQAIAIASAKIPGEVLARLIKPLALLDPELGTHGL